jgi:hypothetical protein
VQFYLSDKEFALLAAVLEAYGAKLIGRSIKGKEKALVTALEKLLAFS